MPFPEDRAEWIYTVPKLILPDTWLDDIDATGRVLGSKIRCDLFAEGAVVTGARVRCRVSAGSLHKANMQCEMEILAGKKREVYVIYRLDLNPTSQHSNDIKTGDVDSGRVIKRGQTHGHCFRDRVSDDRPDGFGRPITAPPRDFADAFVYLCDTLNIGNAGDMPAPTIQGLLL